MCAGSSDDDAFYDRTRQEGVAAAITLVGGKKAKKEVVAIDAATLSAQRETLHAEKAVLVKRIEEEKLLAMEVPTPPFMANAGILPNYIPPCCVSHFAEIFYRSIFLEPHHCQVGVVSHYRIENIVLIGGDVA